MSSNAARRAAEAIIWHRRCIRPDPSADTLSEIIERETRIKEARSLIERLMDEGPHDKLWQEARDFLERTTQ